MSIGGTRNYGPGMSLRHAFFATLPVGMHVTSLGQARGLSLKRRVQKEHYSTREQKKVRNYERTTHASQMAALPWHSKGLVNTKGGSLKCEY
eukprot:3429015-Amphidinium_carterae.1